jgi:hypothetical protein
MIEQFQCIEVRRGISYDIASYVVSERIAPYKRRVVDSDMKSLVHHQFNSLQVWDTGKSDRIILVIKRTINFLYSLRSIILFANMDVSRHILVIDTSVLAKSNMDRREYLFFLGQVRASENIKVNTKRWIF